MSLEMVGQEVAYYCGQPEDVLMSCLKTTESIPSMIELLYQLLTNRKEIVPIENYEGKAEIWNEVKDWEMPREQKIKVAKCIYLVRLIKK